MLELTDFGDGPTSPAASLRSYAASAGQAAGFVETAFAGGDGSLASAEPA